MGTVHALNTDPKVLENRVSLAESALEKITKKCSELEERERDATRALANDPSDETAKRVKAVHGELETWRAGRVVAEKNLDDAKSSIVDSQSEGFAMEAREIAARCTRRAYHERVAPDVRAIVDTVRDLEAHIIDLMQNALEQQRECERAEQLATLGGITLADVRPVGGEDVASELLVALSRAELVRTDLHRWIRWIPQVNGEGTDRALCTTVLERLGIGACLPPDVMSYAEQIEAALVGDDMHAIVRARSETALAVAGAR